MLIRQPTCAICESNITSENDSNEHVIPQSIGGRKTIRGFICRSCNNRVGESWDAVLAKQLNWFTAAFGVKCERSKGASAAVRTADGNELHIQANGALTRKNPFFQEEISGGVARIRMFARTEAEAREMLKGIKKKYPNFRSRTSSSVSNLTPYIDIWTRIDDRRTGEADCRPDAGAGRRRAAEKGGLTRWRGRAPRAA
jgi:hypothetical protein